MDFPFTISTDSSVVRKLQHWFARSLERSPITEPLRWEGSGQEVPEGRYLMVLADSPKPHPDFMGGPIGTAPLISEVILALVQPGVNKHLNTPEALEDFDSTGRAVGEWFKSYANQRLTDGWVSIQSLQYRGEGSDEDGVDDGGRKIRIYAVRLYVDFVELLEEVLAPLPPPPPPPVIIV
jgi:hypothetical protein